MIPKNLEHLILSYANLPLTEPDLALHHDWEEPDTQYLVQSVLNFHRSGQLPETYLSDRQKERIKQHQV